jgi:hypothetical protein
VPNNTHGKADFREFLPEGGREEGCEVRLEAGRDEVPEGGREMCRAVVLPDNSVAKMRSTSSSVRALSPNCILPARNSDKSAA